LTRYSSEVAGCLSSPFHSAELQPGVHRSPVVCSIPFSLFRPLSLFLP
jgi:hypothetical protein